MNNLHTYHFPFLSSEIKFEFVDNIDPDLASAISDLILILKNDLSPKLKNTSANRFNESGENLPIKVSPEFIEFFETNLKYFLVTTSDFNPFGKNVDKFSIQEFFTIDKDEDVITKFKDFKFNSPLLKFFIVNKIKILLDENNIKDYYFSYVDIAGSFGAVTWRAKLNAVDYSKEIEYKLHNRFAFSFIPDKTKQEKTYSKFANIDPEIKAVLVLLRGNNLMDLKILSLELENLRWLHQYKDFAKENHVDVTVYT